MKYLAIAALALLAACEETEQRPIGNETYVCDEDGTPCPGDEYRGDVD